MRAGTKPAGAPRGPRWHGMAAGGKCLRAGRRGCTFWDVVTTHDPDRWHETRERMLRSIVFNVEPRDPRILSAFRSVPREAFVPEPERPYAYDDRALPIGEGQTISQPTMIAIMLDALECRDDSRALEVGAGCGYAAALLGMLAAEVDAIEILPALAERARATLAELGVRNVRIHVGDGTLGFAERAPFDRILVSAAALVVPAALIEQLAVGGRIAIPVGDRYGQVLQVGEKDATGKMHWHKSVPCMFVPLLGS